MKLTQVETRSIDYKRLLIIFVRLLIFVIINLHLGVCAYFWAKTQMDHIKYFFFFFNIARYRFANQNFEMITYYLFNGQCYAPISQKHSGNRAESDF